jgi:hypothetical protein
VIEPTTSLGEKFTIAGVHPEIRNPDRIFWQFWKPKKISDKSRLSVFTVVAIVKA